MLSSRSQVEVAILLFSEALNSDDVSKLPLAENVEYFGTLLPGPIRGEVDVRDHIQQIAPFVKKVINKKMIIEGDSGAMLSEFEGGNGVHVDEAYFLQVEDGKISEIRTIFDSRPLFSGRPA